MGPSSVCLPAESTNNLSPVGPWAALHKGTCNQSHRQELLPEDTVPLAGLKPLLRELVLRRSWEGPQGPPPSPPYVCGGS